MPKSGEVISLHIGEAGCEFGAACWEQLCFEHEISPSGKYERDSVVSYTFFSETGASKAVPRAAFFDLEFSTIDNIRVGRFRQLFNPSYLINGKEDAANCFGRGFLTLGKQIIEPAKNCVRAIAESCGSIQGFLVFRSYGGGTGSGLTALLLEELSYDYPKIDKFDFSVFMSPTMSAATVEPYNEAFTVHHTLEYSCASFLFDNEACYNICDRLLDICQVRFMNINQLLAQVFSNITTLFRSSEVNYTDLNKLKTNLIAFPRLQYLIASSAPLLSKYHPVSENITESSVINSCFENPYQFIKCDVRKGTYIACSLLLRGNVNNSCVNTALKTIKAKKSIRFVEWTPTQFKVAVDYNPFVGNPNMDTSKTDKSCLMLANSTHVRRVFDRIGKKFDMLYSKKTFVHWYIAEGVEEGDFQDTRLDLNSLITDYSEISLDK